MIESRKYDARRDVDFFRRVFLGADVGDGAVASFALPPGLEAIADSGDEAAPEKRDHEPASTRPDSRNGKLR